MSSLNHSVTTNQTQTNMKLFSILFAVAVSSVIADEAPYPPSGWKPQQQALLLLPPQITPSESNNAPVQDEAETLDKVSENVMDRLRQEVGSNTGLYYVYLPDGKLQRVQYTTAPIRQQDERQSSVNSYQQSSVNFQQSSTGTSPVYQQQYRTNQVSANRYPSNNVQTNHQQVAGNNQNSNQGNQQQFNRIQKQQQYNTNAYQQGNQQQFGAYQQGNQQQFGAYQLGNQQPFGAYRQENKQQFGTYQQQFGESRKQQYNTQFQGNQYLAPSPAKLQTVNDKKEAESGNPSQILAHYNEEEKNAAQQVPTTGYLASVHFADVPPITGPIFAYNPSPLVRIVRYADNYQ